MKQIKTIMRPIDVAGDTKYFDDEVNAALAEGWRLQNRLILGAPILAFVAYLEKRDPEQELTEEEKPLMRSEGVGYAGFLYIRCEECGAERGFNAKKPTKAHICSCGHRTPLADLARVEARCECGQSWRYYTNIRDKTFTMSCLRCGSPIDLELHHKDNAYVTM